MIIANRSIHIIDYENNRILSRDIPATFDEYVGELIEHINRNDSVRDYKTRSRYTEVISGAIAISSQKDISIEHIFMSLREEPPFMPDYDARTGLSTQSIIQ